MMVEIPTIPEFYRNKTVFITGGSGFIGKVLIEKLLRSCPNLKTIYLLLREKKGQTPYERVKTIIDLPLFDVLKSKNLDSLDKIKTVVGDVRELDLGLNLQERQLLIDEVNVVFHVAASVRFDDSLTDAVIMNTRGTREVAKLVLEMKNLDVFVHISTTYCNSDRKVVEEKLYPVVAEWEKTIEIAENIDRHTLNVLTEKYIHPQPNTYTFAKSLGEHVVYDMCNGKIPLVVYRPSVIISTDIEPFFGWVDNFNGPVALIVGYGKGILRTLYSDPNNMMDYVPADITVKAIIISSWKQATYKDANQRLTASFYNGSNNGVKNINVQTLLDMGQKVWNESPFDSVLWYPKIKITNCYYSYIFRMIMYQLVPALLVDGLLKLMGKQPMITKIQRKIHAASIALAYFTHNNWTFVNHKFLNLQDELLPADAHDFRFQEFVTPMYPFLLNCSVGLKKYLLKESNDADKAKKNMLKMWVLAQFVNFLWYLGLFWLVFIRIGIVSVVFDMYNDIILYFTSD
ncbi:fatty acyl-CoA reductase 1-like [Zophobas morio]|uniref:fatty acyl-CoA reductase 1-like n=1 Tax=Zophobas morio TaxID=2755281 RepID=UPI00308341A5